MHLMRLFIYFLKAGVKNIHFEFYKRWTNDLIMYSFRERRCDASYYEASFPEVASPARTWRLYVFLAQTWIETSLNELLIPLHCRKEDVCLKSLLTSRRSWTIGFYLSGSKEAEISSSVCLRRGCCFQLVIMDLFRKLLLVKKVLDSDVFEVANMSEINKADPHGCDNGALTDRFGVLIQGLLAVIAFSTLMGKFLFPAKQPNRSVFADGWSK